MDSYWFLYNSDGTIYETPFKGVLSEWPNIPDGCKIISYSDDAITDIVKDAYSNYVNYKFVDGSLTKITDATNLNLIKEIKISKLNAACGNAIINEFYSSADGEMRLYDFETIDQLNISTKSGQLEIEELAGQTVSDFSYYAHDGNCHNYTAAQFIQLAKDGINWVTKCTTYYQDTLKPKVNACTTVTEVEAITWDLANNSASTTTSSTATTS